MGEPIDELSKAGETLRADGITDRTGSEPPQAKHEQYESGKRASCELDPATFKATIHDAVRDALIARDRDVERRAKPTLWQRFDRFVAIMGSVVCVLLALSVPGIQGIIWAIFSFMLFWYGFRK